MKLKTCIICGNAAGSGEHVFPASLGGRRTNRGIYCTPHDNGYSSLVATLAEQLDLFNSMLGVVGDHDKKPRSVQLVDQELGVAFRTNSKGAAMVKPRVLSSTPVPGGSHFEMTFPDQESVDNFVAQQKALGNDVQILRKGERGTFFAGTSHVQKKFGGAFGLAAVAYVAQTFFAQEFPMEAREPGLAAFKQYTMGRAQECTKGLKPSTLANVEPIWWDFDPPRDLPANSFEFGHMVLVGVDQGGRCFGRLSFFSTLHFAIDFGSVAPPTAPKTVIINIDPIAERAPNDVAKSDFPSVIGAVQLPTSATQGLAHSVSEGKSKKVIDLLMQRLHEFEADKTSARLHARLDALSKLPDPERRNRFESALADMDQRIWNATRAAVLNVNNSREGAVIVKTVGDLSVLVKRDPTSADGLSARARQSFDEAKRAFVDQMLADQTSGSLTKDRVQALLYEGAGVALAGRAVLMPFMDTAPLLRRLLKPVSLSVPHKAATKPNRAKKPGKQFGKHKARKRR